MRNSSKRVIPAFIAVFISLTFLSCQQDEDQIQKGKISFTFQPSKIVNGRAAAAGKTATVDARFLLISVEDLQGRKVYDRKVIALYSFGSEFISEPLDFVHGQYRLTEFLVLGENHDVLFATPIEGSALAHLVEDALPIDFTIKKDQTTKVTPQVLAIDAFNPGDFGYTTFAFDVVEGVSFQVAVFVYDSALHNFKLTTSHIAVHANGNPIFEGNLPDSTARLIVADGFETYHITVSKPGYTAYEHDFTAAELERYFKDEVLTIELITPDVSLENMAIKLDGLNDFIEFGNIYDSTVLPVTISAWIRLENVPYQAPIFISQDNSPYYNGFTFATSPTNISAGYGDGRGENHSAYRRDKSAYVSSDITKQWVHVCAVIKGYNEIDLYFNSVNVGGEYYGESELPMDSDFPDDVARAGRWMSNGLDIYFNGDIDEISVWKTALSSSDVSYIKNHRLSGSEAGLIGYWDFDEADGDIVYDKSYNQYHGVLKNGAHRVPSGAQVE